MLGNTDIDRLCRQLEETQVLLEEKDKDLRTAAEIGQAVLTQNQQLKLEIDDLQNMIKSKQSIEAKYVSLDANYQELLKKNELMETDLNELKSLARNKSENIKRHESEQTQVATDIKLLNQQIDQLGEEKHRLQKEKLQLNSSITDLEELIKKEEGISSGLRLENHQLQSSLNHIERQHCECTKNLQSLQTETENLQNKNDELSELIETYQTYRETCEDQALLIEQLNMELEWARESNQKLTARLAVLEPDSLSIEPDQGNKTLLSEIEDRRQELIKKHEDLAQQHKGLTQSHLLSLTRQQKMKHHIQRLSQLTTSDKVEDKTKILEDALNQCMAENVELERKLESLQRKSSFSYSQPWDDEDDGFEPATSNVDSQYLEVLQFRIENLMSECDTLKNENKTLRLVKTSETEKLLHTSMQLNEKERECDNLRRSLANQRFELEEMKLAICTEEFKEQQSEPLTPIQKETKVPVIESVEQQLISEVSATTRTKEIGKEAVVNKSGEKLEIEPTKGSNDSQNIDAISNHSELHQPNTCSAENLEKSQTKTELLSKSETAPISQISKDKKPPERSSVKRTIVNRAQVETDSQCAQQ